MNSADMLAACQRLEKAMGDRGMVCPEVQFAVNKFGANFCVHAEHKKQKLFGENSGISDREYEFCKGDTAEQALAAAETWLANLPDPGKAQRERYIRAVNSLIDEGREFGIPDDLIAPLLNGRDIIAERLLTYDPEAA